MEFLGLTGGLIYIGVLGCWLMGKLDSFISAGGISPYWDGEEETADLEASRPGAQHSGQNKKDSSEVS